jgi:hypothetical protein
VIASAPTLVGSPFTMVGGLGLVTLGLVDQAINWRKTLIDSKMSKAVVSKTELERKKLELEIEEKKLQLQKIRLGLGLDEEGSFAKSEPLARADTERINEEIDSARYQLQHLADTDAPPSAVVPHSLITEIAEREGISSGLASHLVNRASPAFCTLRQYFQKIELIREQNTPRRRSNSPHREQI